MKKKIVPISVRFFILVEFSVPEHLCRLTLLNITIPNIFLKHRNGFLKKYLVGSSLSPKQSISKQPLCTFGAMHIYRVKLCYFCLFVFNIMKDWKSIPKQVFKSHFFHFISDILFLRKRSFA